MSPARAMVGSTASVVFAATEATPRHFENPLQVPAYEYPGEYGPRSPSFARATVVAQPGPCLFVSGTRDACGTQRPDDELADRVDGDREADAVEAA